LKVAAEKLGKYDDKLGQVDYTKNTTPYAVMLSQTVKTVATLDFTSERKTMSTVVKGLEGNHNSVLLKGAPERVIEKCESYKNAEGKVVKFTAEDKQRLINECKKYASQALRCLGVAVIYDGGKLADLTSETIESKLSDINSYSEYERGGTFLGIMGIKDPIRQEALTAIEDCKTAGIRVIMITGDSKETAVAIAKELKIID
jgi:magnesium-transporting ATPase (P-type)